MSLKTWLENGWLRKHAATSQEINDLLQIVERDLQDARAGLSNDWQFGIAYNAALKICTILLHAEGYRSERNLHHYRTIQALPLILGQSRKEDANYLDACRVKRNIVEYDRVGAVSDIEVQELIALVEELREVALEWLKNRHPELLLKLER
jgi:hypothetical protein